MAESGIKKIRVGAASCGIAAGANELIELLLDCVTDGIPVEQVGCMGHCYAEPIVEVETETASIFYGNVKATKSAVENILALGEDDIFTFPPGRSARESLKITHLAGRIPPVDLDKYIAKGGYKGLKKALAMPSCNVIDEVKTSGLRGRGGGGFPTGLKWEFLAKSESDEKVLICNADEGDPGAFMDRVLMESVPHQILEGMLIAAYATGASKVFIYCRAEYPLAIKNLTAAFTALQSQNLNHLNGKSIDIVIKEGAGAFVCGEETSMIASLEGRRGTPRFRPPFPTESGWKGFPTLINNVETFANIPLILNGGGALYAKTGTAKSTGTKIFALAGDLERPGLVEVPMGTTLEEIVFDIGGAKRGSVKAVQTGGPSGGCIPEEHFDITVDYDSLRSLGAIMGSGGLIVIGKNRCMVETARYFLDFTHRESCGKCTFCRIGTKRMLEKLEKITTGNGTNEDIRFLEEMAPKIIKGSLCGLGQTAPNPVLSTLRYFMDEYLAHVNDKTCPALECSSLVNVTIDKTRCIECGICIRNCPVDAISDDFIVDNSKCTRCNSCIELCPKKTIHRTGNENGFVSAITEVVE